MKLNLIDVNKFGPSLTVDNMILFCIYEWGMWQWIGTHHKEIDYGDDGLKIIGVDVI